MYNYKNAVEIHKNNFGEYCNTVLYILLIVTLCICNTVKTVLL